MGLAGGVRVEWEQSDSVGVGAGMKLEASLRCASVGLAEERADETWDMERARTRDVFKIKMGE